MKVTPKRKSNWPRKISLGRVSVTIYKRIAPNGSPCFMVANYSSGKRRFDSYANETLALDAAGLLVRQMSERQVVAAAMTNEQASEYAAAVQTLKPFNVGLLSVAENVAEALKFVSDLSGIVAAARFYKERHKSITPKRVADVVAELVAMKKARKKSPRHIRDLSSRLNRFAEVFKRDICNVTTPDVQGWLDGMALSARSIKNYRAALASLFSFAEARGYIFKGGNPIDDTEKVSMNDDSAIEIFTPKEISALLKHAPKNYLPLLVLGAFAGLRTAEAERLEWRDMDTESGFITVAPHKAKTRSRRLVPILPNLAAWLKDYADQTGRVWKGSERERKRERRAMLKASGIKWKHNALRHSFISYRVAATHDAAKVSLEAGNSPQMIFRHYRELVKPAAAMEWFSVLPEGELAPVTTKVVPIVNHRQSQPSIARLPQVGTTAAN